MRAEITEGVTMVSAKSNNMRKRIVVIGLLLFLAAGSIVAFRVDVLGLTTSYRRASFSKELLESISIAGAVREEHLDFTGKEIHDINYAVLKHKALFPRVDVSLNMADKFAPVSVEPETKLDLGLAFQVSGGGEVRCWNRTVSRKRLVPYMVRAMDRAAREYGRFLENEGTKGFKRFYI